MKIEESKVLKNFSDFGTLFLLLLLLLLLFLTNRFWNNVTKYLIQNRLVVSLIYIYIYVYVCVCVCVCVEKRNLQ